MNKTINYFSCSLVSSEWDLWILSCLHFNKLAIINQPILKDLIVVAEPSDSKYAALDISACENMIHSEIKASSHEKHEWCKITRNPDLCSATMQNKRYGGISSSGPFLYQKSEPTPLHFSLSPLDPSRVMLFCFCVSPEPVTAYLLERVVALYSVVLITVIITMHCLCLDNSSLIGVYDYVWLFKFARQFI